MPIANTLRAFGFTEPFEVEREFTTELGAPKAVVRVARNTRVFIGSLGRYWPTKDHLEQVLPRLNEVAERLAAHCADVRLGPYSCTPSGEYAFFDGTHHRFITPVFDGRDARPGRDSSTMARALGLLHHASIEAVQANPTWGRREGYTRDTLATFTLPNLDSAELRGLPDPDRRLSSVREIVGWVLDHRAAAIDGLPAIYSHNDFQAKNVLVKPRLLSRSLVRIIDMESAAWQTRLADLYFLLAGDDSHSQLTNLRYFAANLLNYVRVAGPLTTAELHLLPNVLQCKAAGIAAWAAEVYPQGNSQRRTILATIFRSALQSVSVLHDRREEIRAIARDAKL